MRIERIELRSGSNPAAVAREIRLAMPTLDEVGGRVREILAAVAERGDEGALDVAREVGEEPASLRVDPARCQAALEALDPELRAALELARENLTRVAEAELAAVGGKASVELAQGQTVTIASRPVAAAGVYAPGGKAPLASSALMCLVPAKVAGVGRIAVASPPGPGGEPAGVVLAVCALCDAADEVIALGGAQAVAALALGTETVAPVDVVAGPGNRYVQEAKRLLYGRVGIDSLAGPSEIVVVADAGADPELIALDVCAQGEHGSDGPLVVIATDTRLLDAVAARIESFSAEHATIAEDARATLILAEIESEALALSDALAPEHLELALDGAGAAMAAERVAGAVFYGAGSATAFGDYAAGSNHVLPTGGSARFAGPLGVGAFLRRSSAVEIPVGADAGLASAVDLLARAEGLEVHARSARARSTG
ncbi:histidinol dehydrogenase [Thermoleophilia bacterium SCSIO 60948]|nr:histidinol dehydrogenase [Thermoleophilia bacterium SCSIO 60948]